jgi:hypothetical protein
MTAYDCYRCGKPVERAIEGELICSQCWSQGEMDDDARACDAAIEEYEQWGKTHCPRCEGMWLGGGLCPTCTEEDAQEDAMLVNVGMFVGAELEAERNMAWDEEHYPDDDEEAHLAKMEEQYWSMHDVAYDEDDRPYIVKKRS